MFLVSCATDDDLYESQGEVIVNLTLSELPASFPRALETKEDPDDSSGETPDSVTEYRWEVYFDVDNSGAINEGDIFFRIPIRAYAADFGVAVARESLQAFAYLQGDGGEHAYNLLIGEVDLEVTATTFIITAEYAIHDRLTMINSDTNVFVNSVYRFRNVGETADSFYRDYYPHTNYGYTSTSFPITRPDGALDIAKDHTFFYVSPEKAIEKKFIDIEKVSFSCESFD